MMIGCLGLGPFTNMTAITGRCNMNRREWRMKKLATKRNKRRFWLSWNDWDLLNSLYR